MPIKLESKWVGIFVDVYYFKMDMDFQNYDLINNR